MEQAEIHRLADANPGELLRGGWPTPVSAREPEGGWLRRVVERRR
jgi:hypothetical protein